MKRLAIFATMLTLAAACGNNEPVLLPENSAAVPLEADGADADAGDGANADAESPRVLDITATANEAAVAETSPTNPPLTTSSIGTPPPPPTLTGTDGPRPTTAAIVPAPTDSAAGSPSSTVPATVPATRPSGSSTPTTVAPSSATTTRPATTQPATTSRPPTSPPTTSRPTAPPATAAPASSNGVVEFRIRSGTQGGPWNTFQNPVRVQVGQILRIYNDDVVAHTAHSNGVPFEHGPTIQPGAYADHPIVATHDADPASPENYEHDAGVSAPFWVIATAATKPPTTTTTTVAAPTTSTTVSSTTVSTGSDASALGRAEAESLRLLNNLRAGLGAQPVAASDREMHEFARSWSLEMRNTGFRHSSPPKWYENIVWYSDETMTPKEAAAQFHEMWVNSPGHYDNMTNPEWSVVGVGMWHDETGWWGVHVFR